MLKVNGYLVPVTADVARGQQEGLHYLKEVAHLREIVMVLLIIRAGSSAPCMLAVRKRDELKLAMPK